jgi:hypothetical protein
MNPPNPTPKHYFVDEAGDPTIFGDRGKVLVGSPGCSRFFILGLADVEDPQRLASDLNNLRANLLADPYFKDVPSLQPKEGKTAFLFHAKDDLPEIRREVFSLILKHPIRFSAIVRDKLRVLDYVRSRNANDIVYHYNPNELYDFMVRRLFKERLHKHCAYEVYFARRGTSDRSEALTLAVETARNQFAAVAGIESQAVIQIIPTSPIRTPVLQAVDYFLWALQRTFERGEDRFLQLLWPQCSLVIDADDTREKGYGKYYTNQKPLTSAALKEAEGYRSKPPK